MRLFLVTVRGTGRLKLDDKWTDDVIDGDPVAFRLALLDALSDEIHNGKFALKVEVTT